MSTADFSLCKDQRHVRENPIYHVELASPIPASSRMERADWRSICLGSYQSRGSFWRPMWLLDVPTCPSHAWLQQDSRTVGLLLLREIKTCAYIFLLSAAYSSYSSIKYTIRSVTTVSFPCCCCCTTRRSEAFHNLKLPNPHFLYLLSFTSAHICLKFLTFHIIHVDKFGLCLYFTCH